MPEFNPYESPQTELAKSPPLITVRSIEKFVARLGCGLFAGMFVTFGMQKTIDNYLDSPYALPIIVLLVGIAIFFAMYSSFVWLRLLAWIFAGNAFGCFAAALYSGDIDDFGFHTLGVLCALFFGWLGYNRWPELPSPRSLTED